MIAEKEKATASTAAKDNKLQYKSYRRTAPLSSLKTQIGELLFALLTGNKKPDGWQRFDRLLHRFYQQNSRQRGIE